MNTLRQDEFWEDRLRQTIRDAETDPEAQAWDTPSEAVWEQVSGTLEEKRRRLPLLFWWSSLAALVLLTSGGIWLALEKQPPVLNPQVENVEAQFPGKGQVNRQPQTESPANLLTPANSKIPAQARSENRRIIAQAKKRIDNQVIKQSENNISSTHSTFPSPESLTSGNAGLPSTQVENALNPVGFTRIEAVEPLATLETALLPNTSAPTSFPAIPVKTDQSKLQWWAGIRGGPVYAVNSVRSRQPGALLFRNQETSQFSSEWGLNLKMVTPSGWYAQAGVGQFGMRQSASQVFRLRFERARERQLPSGEWESTFALSVPSSFGDSEAELDLRRDDSNTFQEGQILIVETKTSQALAYLSYSLGSGFLKSSGRWTYGAGAGIALNVLQSREFTLTAQSRQAGIQLPVTRIRRSFSEASAQTTDLQLSATLGYRMSPRWMIGVEPTLRHSLSPVVRHSGFSTAATAAGLQLSVHYLL